MKCTCYDDGVMCVLGVDCPKHSSRATCQGGPSKSFVKERLSEIFEESSDLKSRLRALEEERSALEMTLALMQYTCECVSLNRKLGIHDMVELEGRNRNGLQIGLVSETLSASRACPACRGSGIPRASRVDGSET